MEKTRPQSVSVRQSSPHSLTQARPRMTFVRSALTFSHTLLTVGQRAVSSSAKPSKGFGSPSVTTSTTQSSPLRDARRKMWRSSPLPVVSS